jgi:gas vesicle protein
MGTRADAMSAEGPEVLPPDGGSYDATGKSPEQIEADLAKTRAGIGEILDAIERRLAPRHLLGKGIDMVKDTMSRDDGGLGDMLRSHPLPLALIGMGVGWLLTSSTARGRLAEYGGAVKERVAGATQSAGGRAGELAGQLRHKMAGWGAAHESGAAARYPTESAGYAYARQKSGEALDKASDAVAEAGGKLGDTIERGRQAGSAAWQQARSYAKDTGPHFSRVDDRFGDLMQEHPLAVGALGFLAGAVIALLLPKSGLEERVAGDAGDALRERAADLGRAAAERARGVAERTADAAVGAVKEATGQATSESAPDLDEQRGQG